MMIVGWQDDFMHLYRLEPKSSTKDHVKIIFNKLL